MPARDIYHDVAKEALTNDGWVITDDPLRLPWGSTTLLVDLGAENLLAAEKDQRRIAVEIKTFSGPSTMASLEQAIGQYIVYHDILAHLDPDRALFLMLHLTAFERVFEEPIGRVLLDNGRLRLIVFDPEERRIIRWIL